MNEFSKTNLEYIYTDCFKAFCVFLYWSDFTAGFTNYYTYLLKIFIFIIVYLAYIKSCTFFDPILVGILSYAYISQTLMQW